MITWETPKNAEFPDSDREHLLSLGYAWNQLEEGSIVDVSRMESTSLVDLFARVLTTGVEHLAKRGLERVYVRHEEEMPGIRGRIDLLQTERRMLRKHARAACIYDDLTVNSVPNQIIKATLKTLAQSALISSQNRDGVVATSRHMQGVSNIRITAGVFRRVQLPSNSRYYRFLLNVFANSLWIVAHRRDGRN